MGPAGIVASLAIKPDLSKAEGPAFRAEGWTDHDSRRGKGLTS
jgi:hypothetical protein